MSTSSVISKTELARQTRQVLSRVRRESPLIVESYGQEEAAILDILDYRLLRAAAIHLAEPTPVQPVPRHEQNIMPQGLEENLVRKAVEASGGDTQVAWNLVIGKALDGHISLARAAELLQLSRFELAERFRRHSIPLPVEPLTEDELLAEAKAFRR